MEPENKFPPELTNETHKQFYVALQKGLETLLLKYPLTPENNWTISEKKDDYITYSKHDKETGFNWSRGEAVIYKDGKEIVDYINDISKKSEWDQQFDSGRTVDKITDNIFTSYQRFKPIFPTGARDFSMAVGTFVQNENLLTLVVVSINNPSVPEEKGFTRAHLHLGGWVLEKIAEKQTKVSYLSLVDPKGWIPKSVVNVASKSQAMCVYEIKKKIEQK